MDPLLVAKMIDEEKFREEKELEAALGVNNRHIGRIDEDIFVDALATGYTQRDAALLAGSTANDPAHVAWQKLTKQPYLREQVAEKVREKKMMLLAGVTEEKRNEAGLKEITSSMRDLQNVEDNILGVDNTKVIPNIVIINYDQREQHNDSASVRSREAPVAVEGIAREVTVQDFGDAKKIRKDRARNK